MTDYSFTNRPDLPTGIYGHHLMTQWNINQSDMLASMHASGVINFRDFNLNGAPLAGSISAAELAGSSLHLPGNNHPDLRPALRDFVVNPIEHLWEARVEALESSGTLRLEAERIASAEFAPRIQGDLAVLRTGVNPLLNAAGDFVDFSGRVLSLDEVRTGGWYMPLTAQDPLYVARFGDMPLDTFYSALDTSQWATRIDYRLGEAGIVPWIDALMPGATSGAGAARTSALLEVFQSEETALASGADPNVLIDEVRAFASGGAPIGEVTGTNWGLFDKLSLVGIGVGTLHFLGPAGDALAFGVTAANAIDLTNSGDDLGAARAWLGWAANMGGSVVGGVAGGLALSFSGPGALGGAIVGGYAGGEAAEGLANLIFDYGIAPTALYIHDLLPPSQAPNASQLSLMDIEGGVAWVDPTGFAWQTATGNAAGFGELTYYRADGGVNGVQTLRPDGTTTTTLYDAFGREVTSWSNNQATGEQVIRVSDPTNEHGWSFNEATIVNEEMFSTNMGLDSGTVISSTRDAATGEWQTTVTTPRHGLTPAQQQALMEQAALNQIDFNLQNYELAGGEIGQIFGSSLGQALAGDNVFAQVASSTVLGTLLQNVGETWGRSVTTGQSLLDAAIGDNGAFNDFDAELGQNFQQQALGAVSGFLLGELAEVLEFDGEAFGDQLFRASAGSLANTVAHNALANRDLLFGIDGNLATGIGSFIGGYIAREIVAPETVTLEAANDNDPWTDLRLAA